jgi:hypothetical protein
VKSDLAEAIIVTTRKITSRRSSGLRGFMGKKVKDMTKQDRLEIIRTAQGHERLQVPDGGSLCGGEAGRFRYSVYKYLIEGEGRGGC